jgi:hypothetical protein
MWLAVKHKRKTLKKNEVIELLSNKLNIDSDVLNAIIQEYWDFILNSFVDYDSVQIPIGRVDATCTKIGKLYV